MVGDGDPDGDRAAGKAGGIRLYRAGGRGVTVASEMAGDGDSSGWPDRLEHFGTFADGAGGSSVVALADGSLAVRIGE